MDRILDFESPTLEPISHPETELPLDKRFVVVSIEKAWERYHSAVLEPIAEEDKLNRLALTQATAIIIQACVPGRSFVTLPESVWLALGGKRTTDIPITENNIINLSSAQEAGTFTTDNHLQSA